MRSRLVTFWFLGLVGSLVACAKAEDEQSSWTAPAEDSGLPPSDEDTGSAEPPADSGSTDSGSKDTGSGTKDTGTASASGCADPSLVCTTLGTLGDFCVQADMAPPSSAKDCTGTPSACAAGFSCLSTGGKGYCLEKCGSAPADSGPTDTGTGSTDTGTTDTGSGGGPVSCASVTNPSKSCCVDDTHALDCKFGTTPIDCSTFKQVCGWDSLLKYYTCVDAPATSASSSAEPRMCAGGASAGSYDGTVGKACATDAECKKVSGSTAVCSNNFFTGGPRMPDPVCFLKGCDPGTDGKVHFCDGPDAPTSPGICTAATGSPTCRAKCEFKPDGAASKGCVGNDHCFAYGFGSDATGVFGLGICSVGCTSSAQCPAGSSCDPLLLSCVTTVGTPTLKVGDACTASSSCYCTSSSSTVEGYCTQRCVVGNGTNDGCPTGFTCDAFLPKKLSGGAAAFSAQNVGMLGECRKKCAAGDVCPGATKCVSDTVAGPDCQ